MSPNWLPVPATFSKLNNTEFVMAIDQVGRRAKNQAGMFVHGQGGTSLASSDFGSDGMALSKGTGPVSSVSIQAKERHANGAL